MKQYYECHITMLGEPQDLQPKVENLKWKFSVINGDPVLGDGIKCYATMFFKESMRHTDVMDILIGVASQLSYQGANVIRRKVERVIYDDRSTAVRLIGACVGACPECHLDDLT